jgi:peptide/nickel transport system permease protein
VGGLSFFGRRILQTIPVLFGISLVSFFLIHLIPGDPVQAMLGNHYTPKAAAALRHSLGLDTPLPNQYLLFLTNLLHGNLGQSVYYQQSVTQVVMDRVEPTAWLVVYSSVLAVIIAFPLGVLAALRPDGVFDQIIRALFVTTLAMPSFWLGIILILFLAVDAHLFPVSGFGTSFTDHLQALFLPSLTVAAGFGAVLIRSLRNSVIETMQQDFTRTARAKGLRFRIVLMRHVVRNALLPVITVFSVNIAFLLGSTVIIENVFAIGGVGQLLVTSILQRDYPIVQGITLLLAVLVVTINFLTDIVYSLLDPRISYG